MGSKSASAKIFKSINPFVAGLIILLCAVVLYVVLNQQTQLEHQALLERIGIFSRIR